MSEFKSHWVSYLYVLVPHLSKNAKSITKPNQTKKFGIFYKKEYILIWHRLII